MSGAQWIVRGLVQGVGFRWYVQRTAERLGLRGRVRNLHDGSVEVLAHGGVDELDALHEALVRGPAGARVVTVDRAPIEGGERMPGGFEIR